MRRSQMPPSVSHLPFIMCKTADGLSSAGCRMERVLQKYSLQRTVKKPSPRANTENTPRGCLFRRLCAIVLHMWLFLFAVLPLAVCGSYAAVRSVRPNALIGAYPLLAFYGLVVGAAVCFVGFFFIYSADTVADSVQRQALPYLLYRELLPLLAYAFFALVSRDGAVYVSRAAFPILGGFYTAYLPYYVFSSVVFDRREAGYKATGRLLRRGCSPVLYIGQMDERFSGFRQALFEKTGGRPGCGPQVEKERGAVDTAGGYEAIRGFHTEYGTVPGGIFAGSDEIAVGILKFLHEKQIAVPGETALVSIDNLEIAGYTCPALTTVNVHKRQLGEKAVGLILGKAAVSGQDAVTVTLPTEIVERESC